MNGNDPMFAMSAYWYEQWYKDKVSPNLSRQEKMNLIRKISELSLREPIFYGGLYYPKEEWPELAPYVSPGISKGLHPDTGKSGEITGVQLYAVLMAAAQELGFPTTLGSTYGDRPILPDLPRDTKRYTHRKKDSFEIKEKEKKKTGGLAVLGTDMVPSVENRFGCNEVNGKWFEDYGVCVLSDGRTQGYTAPVKGVYFYWSKGSGSDMIESIGACHVYGDDFYPRGIGTCRSKVDLNLPKSAFKNPRKAMLQAASRVMQGKTKDFGVMFLSPRGRPVGNSAHNAVAGNNPNQVRDLYNNLRLEEIKPFRLRGR